jgi:hypothetical protein
MSYRDDLGDFLPFRFRGRFGNLGSIFYIKKRIALAALDKRAPCLRIIGALAVSPQTCSFVQQMSEGLLERIEGHPRAHPSHDLSDLLALLRRIAVGGTVLAGCLVLSIFAMVQAAACEICQTLVLLRHGVLLEPMTAIELDHLTDRPLLPFNPAHFYV